MATAPARQATSILRCLFLFIGLLPIAACALSKEQQAPTVLDVEAPMELAYWESVVDSGDPAAYEAYLKSYPNGHFSALAELRLDAVIAAQDDATDPEGNRTDARPQTVADDIRFARARSNVRDGPGTDRRIIEKLNTGEEVIVLSEVEGREWYRVALANGTIGFVYAPLLVSSARAESRIAYGQGVNSARREEERLAWERLRDSDDWLDYQRYVWVYGDHALYAPEARWRRERLKTGQEPRLASEDEGTETAVIVGSAVQAFDETSSDAPSGNLGAENLAEGNLAGENFAGENFAGENFDGPWTGSALTRFGTQCKTSYDMDMMVADQQINGAMLRNADRFWIDGSVDDLGSIKDLQATSNRVVTFLVLSATPREIRGRWSMSAKHDYGGSPCSGSFSLYPA